MTATIRSVARYFPITAIVAVVLFTGALIEHSRPLMASAVLLAIVTLYGFMVWDLDDDDAPRDAIYPLIYAAGIATFAVGVWAWWVTG